MFWFLMKYVFLGPILRLRYRPKAIGLENIPTDGPAIGRSLAPARRDTGRAAAPRSPSTDVGGCEERP